MTREGPLLETLIRRLAETPADFLSDAARTVAVVNDVLRARGATRVPAELTALAREAGPHGANRQKLARVLAWLLADDAFAAAGDPLAAILVASAELGPVVPAKKVVADAERREELARLALAKLGLRPQGESEELAKDRLTALSSVERMRVVAASRAAEQRARKIREELVRKAAEESADKWGRE